MDSLAALDNVMINIPMNFFIKMLKPFSDCFADFPKLVEIHFEFNQFTTLKSYQFGGIAKTWVDIVIRHNLISSIEPDAFESKIFLPF